MRSRAWIAACLLGLAVNALIYWPGLRWDPNNDFLGLYPGGRLAGSARIYDVAAVGEVQQEAAGVTNASRIFIRPPFYALALWPLGRLPYRAAYLLFQLGMAGALAIFLWLWRTPDARAVTIACCCSMPLFGSFVFAEDLPVLLAVFAASYLLLRDGREFAAGLAMALCSMKPHLFVLLPVVIAARRMWRFGGGLAAGGTALVGLSFWGGGRDWIGAFVRTATLKQAGHNEWLMPNLYGLLSGTILGQALWPELAGLLAVAALVWTAARSGSLEWALGAALAGGIVVSHHAYVVDCALLIPALLALWTEAQQAWQRWLAVAMLSPLPYVAMYFSESAMITRVLLILLAASYVEVPRRNQPMMRI